MTQLRALGFNDDFAAAFADGPPGRIARVIAQHRIDYELLGEDEPFRAPLTPSLLDEAAPSELPGVGDWVVVAPGRAEIVRRLPRKTVLLRRAPGRREEPQLVAANVDTVMVVTAFDADFNIRRLERYLTAIRDGGAAAVVVVNKLDIADRVPGVAEGTLEALEALRAERTLLTCAADGRGTEELRALAGEGVTVALVGSSGVGKSSLVNVLLGTSRQRINAVRERDGRGTHTTTRRELFRLPGGGLLVDTPGMREIEPWLKRSGRNAFPDVLELAVGCRFRDCQHRSEPGCAVRLAVEGSRLEASRLDAYQELVLGVAKEERHRRRG